MTAGWGSDTLRLPALDAAVAAAAGPYRTCASCGGVLVVRAMYESQWRPGRWYCRSLRACAARSRRAARRAVSG